MLEAYAIGVKLEMTSNVGGILDKLMTEFERFNTLVKETSTALGRLGRNLRADSSSLAGLDRMAEAMKAAEAAGSGLTRSLERNAALAGDTAKAMTAGARAMEQANRAAGSSGGHGGGRFSEHNLMMGGMGAGIVGGALLDAVRHTMTPAIDVNRTRDVLAADMRLSPDQVDAALARARETTKLAPGTTIGENLASTLDLKSVFGSLDEAEKMLPAFGRMTALFQALDRKGGGQGDQSFAAAKALEVMGGMVDEKTDAAGHTVRTIDPELGMRRLKDMERVAVATNMRVMPSDYLAFAKQARVAGMTLSDEFVYQKLPAMLQVLGGQRVGTALMSMAQVFRGDKLTDKSMGAMIDIGLAGPNGLVTVGSHRGRNGRMTKGKLKVNPDAIYDLDVMGHDPQTYLEAAQKRMEAKGIHGTEAQINALMRAAQRATIAGILADMLKDTPAILKEQQNVVNTRPDMAEHMAATSPAAKVQQFEAALTNLATEMGSAGMNDAMRVLDAVTAGLTALGDWAHNNPGLARTAFDVAAGLGAVATGLGALSTAILVFGPALKLLGVGGGGGAAAAGGGILSRLGAGLGLTGLGGPLAAAGAGLYMAWKSGRDPDYAAKEKQRELDAAKAGAAAARSGPLGAPQDGPVAYTPDGTPIRNQSYRTGKREDLHVHVYLDGKQINDGIQVHRNRNAQRPRTGPSTPDNRLHLLYST
jgi:hypothetical protein